MDLQRFQREGLPYLKTCSEKDFTTTIEQLLDQYHNQAQSSISDSTYDLLREYALKRWPKNPVFQSIGVAVSNTHAKVSLPICMTSLDKIKPDTDALKQWCHQYAHPSSYLISNKLDGVSALLCFKVGKPVQIFTRGDGFTGQDISHLVPHFRQLPKTYIGGNDSVHFSIMVRGEIIVSKQVWQDQQLHREFANIRNMVSGIVNAKKIPHARILDFVAYELIEPVKAPSDQLVYLDYLGFQVVDYAVVDHLTNHDLSQRLLNNRTQYAYEIDGLVVAHNTLHPRRSDGKNPDHAFAFKMVLGDQQAEATVVDVLWAVSKDGYLKPRVQIEPVQLCGVRIEYATGFNAKFILENRIGIGAIIVMERSGDVIPTIRQIVKPADIAKMPAELSQGLVVWSSSGVDLILNNPGGDIEVQKKRITAFFRGLKIDGLSEGNVQRLYEAGFQTIPAILHMSRSDFLRVPGFQDRMADKLHKAILEGRERATLVEWMAASGIFGRGLGTRKLQALVDSIQTRGATLEQVVESELAAATWAKWLCQNTEGIGLETAKEFMEKMPAFLEFSKECDLSANQSPVKNSMTEPKMEPGPYTGKKIVLTKISPRELTTRIVQWIEQQGGIIGDQVNKQTDLVICGSLADDSTKLKKARESGIRIVEAAEFVRTMLL